MLAMRRPAEVLLLSTTGAGFTTALQYLGPYRPVLARTAELRDGALFFMCGSSCSNRSPGTAFDRDWVGLRALMISGPGVQQDGAAMRAPGAKLDRLDGFSGQGQLCYNKC